MAIICLRLDAEAKIASDMTRSLVDEETCKMGDYRDILSLTRVLVHGPESKVDVDNVIER